MVCRKGRAAKPLEFKCLPSWILVITISGQITIITFPQKSSPFARRRSFSASILCLTTELQRFPHCSGSSPILVVKDHPLNRAILLKLLGCRFRSGDSACIILMGVNMPVTAVVTACQEIRRIGWERSLAAFAANVLCGDSEKYVPACVTGYLRTPIQKSKLVHQLVLCL